MLINIKKFIMMNILLFMAAWSASGQAGNYRTLSVGDTLPPLVLKGFLGDSLKQKPLSSYYGGRLLLLDLSATWCVPCVEAWPKLDSLQKASNGALQVLAVTQEKRGAVKAFFHRNPQFRWKMEFIIDNIRNNPALFYAFPHKMVPQVIWVNHAGKVIAITDGDQVTPANISLAMNTGGLNLKMKRDVMDFDGRTYNIVDSNAVYKSLITGFQPGLPAGAAYAPAQGIDDVKGVHRVLMTNIDVRNLYYLSAYFHTVNMLNDAWLIWDTPDSIRMKYQYAFYEKKVRKPLSYEAWSPASVFCYQLQVQGMRPFTELKKRMINDLNFTTGLYGRMEERMVPCDILKKTG